MDNRKHRIDNKYYYQMGIFHHGNCYYLFSYLQPRKKLDRCSTIHRTKTGIVSAKTHEQVIEFFTNSDNDITFNESELS